MANYVAIAKKYSEAGYSVIPVTSNKNPAIREWKEFQERPMTDKECEKYFRDCYGIALLCGIKNVTALDFDLKYDLSGDLFDRFKEKIPKDLLKKMFVQSTKSGGYHFAFSCTKVEGSKKLASRYTTAFETHSTYMENFNDPLTRDKALKIASNDKTRVLIETRGVGGYICISPTPNYNKVYGKLSEITEDEYELLLSAAREFNDVREVKKDPKAIKYNDWKVTPMNDFNDNYDLVNLMLTNGWDTVGRRYGRSVRLKRPGQVHSNSSALYDTDRKILSVFSTSTSFDVGRSYSPTDVFCELECGGDLTLALQRIIDMGFGKR